MNPEIREPQNFRYYLPVEVFFGRGLLSRLDSFILFDEAEKVLVVAGEHLKKDGTVDGLISRIGSKILVYQSRISKSDLTTINQLTSFCRTEKPDLVIAIGGGTILDTAKSAAILAKHPGSVRDYCLKERTLAQPSINFIAIPTTSGTGTEVTRWAVVWDPEAKKKYSLSSPLMFPKMALVDPQLTTNLPPEITASTGMDALAQAVEAYWSRNHNPISDVLALRAIELILQNLERAVDDPNEAVRETMAQGSLLSGLAFSNTKTTICHSVSYPITLHWGVAHGQAVAISLPSFLKYSLSVLGERKQALLDALGVKDEQKAAAKVTSLMKNIGLATRLSQLGIKKENLGIIVKEGFHPDRAGNAPKIPTPDELLKILEEIL